MTEIESSLRSLIQLLVRHEGVRLRAYDDANGSPIVPGYTLIGHPTIGIGRALDVNGVTLGEAYALLSRDISDKVTDCKKEFPFFDELTDARQHVLISMAFQMGIRSVRTFKKMRSALDKRDFSAAANEMLDSPWGRRFAERAWELASMMKTGEYEKKEGINV